jgi:hypothetical protein
MKKNWHWALFIAVFLIHAIVNFFWIKDNFFSHAINSECHMGATGYAYQKITSKEFSIFDMILGIKNGDNVDGMYGVGGYYPPLPHILSVMFLFIKPHFMTLAVQNILYLFFIMLAIYKITDFFLEDKFYSTLAAVIFSFYPIVSFFMKNYEVQLCTLVFVSWGLYFYLISNRLQKLWPSFLFSIFFALSMYSQRLTPALFLAGCFLNPGNFKKKRSILVSIFSAVFICLLCYPFYSRWFKFLTDPKITAMVLAIRTTSPLNAYNLIVERADYLFFQLFYYPLSLPEQSLGTIFTFLLAIGISGLLFFKHEEKDFLILSVFIPWVIFNLYIKKDWGYIFPLLVLFAVITSIGIFKIRSGALKKILIAVIFSGGLLYNIFLYPPFGFLQQRIFTDYFPLITSDDVCPNLLFSKYLPQPSEYSGRFKEVSSFISEGLKRQGFSRTSRGIVLLDFSFAGDRDPVLNSAIFLISRLNFPQTNFFNFKMLGEFSSSSGRGTPDYLITDRAPDYYKDYILAYVSQDKGMFIYKK